MRNNYRIVTTHDYKGSIVLSRADSVGELFKHYNNVENLAVAESNHINVKLQKYDKEIEEWIDIE